MKACYFYGIGVGPGEPELISQKAVEIIQRCDVIILPSKPIENCYAYRIAAKIIPRLEQKQCIPIVFPMTQDTLLLKQALEQNYKIIEGFLEQKKSIACLTIGDPSIYSTCQYMVQMVKQHGYSAQMIAGIPSFCAAAARLGISLGEREEQIHVIPGFTEIQETRQLSGTRIYMKSGKYLRELKEMLLEEEKIRELDIYSISNCGLEDEHIFHGANDIDPESGYMTLVIVKNVKQMPVNSSAFFENRACSYYPCHKNIREINCMFCFCPLYSIENCPGNPYYKEKNGKVMKVCTNCTFPHQKENREKIMELLRK